MLRVVITRTEPGNRRSDQSTNVLADNFQVTAVSRRRFVGSILVSERKKLGRRKVLIYHVRDIPPLATIIWHNATEPRSVGRRELALGRSVDRCSRIGMNRDPEAAARAGRKTGRTRRPGDHRVRRRSRRGARTQSQPQSLEEVSHASSRCAPISSVAAQS